MRVRTFGRIETPETAMCVLPDAGSDPCSVPESPPWEEARQISTSPEDRHPPGERPPPAPDPWDEAGEIPAFLRRTNGDARAPALGPPGDSLDDFQ
jgi:hypothetical protein